jgi:hypothetical protein
MKKRIMEKGDSPMWFTTIPRNMAYFATSLAAPGRVRKEKNRTDA